MKVRVRSEGPKVLVAIDDRAFMEIGHREALELAIALRRAGLQAQEYAEADRLIHEGAMCARAGLPFTLSNHPKIMDEVRKEAAWNSDLRRYMPGGVRAGAVVGTPTIIQE